MDVLSLTRHSRFCTLPSAKVLKQQSQLTVDFLIFDWCFRRSHSSFPGILWDNKTWKEQTERKVEKGSFTFVASIKWTSLRKQLTFHGATTGLPTKWRLRNERKKFHTDDPSLPRSGYCFWLVKENFNQSGSNQFRVITRHQYGISALVALAKRLVFSD